MVQESQGSPGKEEEVKSAEELIKSLVSFFM